MATFVIEGTVSKIIIQNDHDVHFTLCGLEGYSIKHGDKKFNIVCSEDLLKGSQDDNKHQVGIDNSCSNRERVSTKKMCESLYNRNRDMRIY